MIRRLAIEDASFIVELLNDPSFLRFIGDRGVRTEDDARAYLAAGPLQSYRENGFGLYLVTRDSDQTPIGICGLLKRAELDDVDVGFAFMPEHRGHGYAREATTAVLAHAHADCGLGRIVAIVHPDNTASVRLLSILGFVQERAVSLPSSNSRVLLYARRLGGDPIDDRPA